VENLIGLRVPWCTQHDQAPFVQNIRELGALELVASNKNKIEGKMRREI